MRAFLYELYYGIIFLPPQSKINDKTHKRNPNMRKIIRKKVSKQKKTSFKVKKGHKRCPVFIFLLMKEENFLMNEEIKKVLYAKKKLTEEENLLTHKKMIKLITKKKMNKNFFHFVLTAN